jgi:hypothetical protein
MAKVKSPLLSLNAHGQLGKSLIHQYKNTLHNVKKFSYPKKKATFNQLNQRYIMGLLNARWQAFNDATKTSYNNLGANLSPPITGYNYFFQIAQTDLNAYLDLKALYTFDENSTATVTDFSGNGNNGTKYPSFPSNVPEHIDSLNDNFRNALSADGVDDYVFFGNPSFANPGTGPFSISFWFRKDINVSEPIIMKDDYTFGDQNGFYIYTIGGLGRNMRYWNGGEEISFIYELDDNKWNFVTIVRRDNLAGGLGFYVNGILKLC